MILFIKEYIKKIEVISVTNQTGRRGGIRGRRRRHSRSSGRGGGRGSGPSRWGGRRGIWSSRGCSFTLGFTVLCHHMSLLVSKRGREKMMGWKRERERDVVKRSLLGRANWPDWYQKPPRSNIFYIKVLNLSTKLTAEPHQLV